MSNMLSLVEGELSVFYFLEWIETLSLSYLNTRYGNLRFYSQTAIVII